MARPRYAPAGPARAAVRRLVKHYGTLKQASEATGIPYRTLQGIQNPEKLTQILVSTSNRILEADANPPDLKPPPTWERRFIEVEKVYPSLMKLVDHYGTLAQVAQALDVPEHSLRMVKGKYKRGVLRPIGEKVIEAAKNPPDVETFDAWNKRYIATERVRPLLLFLEKAYGSMNTVAEVLDVPAATLRGVKSSKSPGVRRDLAKKIVNGVTALRHGDRTWSTYENEGPPRLATSEEQSLPRGFTRWRHSGGRTR